MYNYSITGVNILAKQSLEMYGVQELDFVSNLDMSPDSNSVLKLMMTRLGRVLRQLYDRTNRVPRT